MSDTTRLIEYAFPLRQASLDSVHEKNVRHGHISTLHIWPARRPLAACRAALLATLLPDPCTREARDELSERIGGKLAKMIEKKKMPDGSIVEREKEFTKGGVLHWLGDEPSSGGKKKREEWRAENERFEQDLVWFREQIRAANGGRAPRVLDPFAGGGAIPLEAMRLGCETTAMDINPVAWFILKCTLEYPQKLAGQKHSLPGFVLKDRVFMEEFFRAHGYGKAEIRKQVDRLGISSTDLQQSLDFEAESRVELEADLAWQLRAWGRWVQQQAQADLARFYPIYAEFEPLEKDRKSYERQEMRLVPTNTDGTLNIDALNSEYTSDYLTTKSNPRWVAKPTFAYLWARTVECKNCRATIPLLKTRWLSRKEGKRVLLTVSPNDRKSGVIFGIERNVPAKGGNAAQRREHDKRLGAGTMTRAGADCPCCGLKGIMTMEDLRLEGVAKRIRSTLTAVVVDGSDGREHRLPTPLEIETAQNIASEIPEFYRDVPFGLPEEAITEDAKHNTWCVTYGLSSFSKLFTDRQLVSLACFARHIRRVREAMVHSRYPKEWIDGVEGYLAMSLDRLLDRCSTLCTPDPSPTQSGVMHVFARFALPMTWDFIEAVTIGSSSGSFSGSLEWVAKVAEHVDGLRDSLAPRVLRASAATFDGAGDFDLIITDPPYYDAIGYAVLMDYFYVWIRRLLWGSSSEFDKAFASACSPKWDHEKNDGELVDDASRHCGNVECSKQVYENGMFRAFQSCQSALAPDGRLVLVFAHKHPNAWEALVSAVIRAGFVVDASWPIQTERVARQRSQSSSALSSSVWLVCKKRLAAAKPGWDNRVLDEMRSNIGRRLRDFWDANVRGPDFVWAATGPALEAFSKHPIVKKADEAGKIMTVSEFLYHARRMVVDFVVGRVLSGGDQGPAPDVDRLDEPTAYYLLHRHYFGLEEAPAGACILYATACGLSDDSLVRDWDLLIKSGSDELPDDDDDGEESDDPEASSEEAGSGSKVRLKPWNLRRGRSLGLEAPGGRQVPVIDQIHRLMQLWKGGDVHKVDEYLDEHGLRRHELFRRVLQSLIELSRNGERTLLESLSNHVGAKGSRPIERQSVLLPAED